MVPPHILPLWQQAPKSEKKKKERYNKLNILWSTTDEQKQAMTIKSKFSLIKHFEAQYESFCKPFA